MNYTYNLLLPVDGVILYTNIKLIKKVFRPCEQCVMSLSYGLL
jgi:hypothetical protein